VRRVMRLGMSLALAVLGTSIEASSAYETVPVADGAAIRGRVTFEGAVPPPERFLITKDPAVCGEGHRERQEVRVRDGALRDVVVVLQGVTRGKAWPESKGHQIDQRRCSFEPYLQVVPNGAELAIVNHDPVLHNIHSFELVGRVRRSLFNLAQPTQGDRTMRTVAPRRGEVIRLECDAHNWMLGWLYVVDHPYYALVGEDGGFTIDQVPPGTYRLRAWHPTLGAQEREVTATAKGRLDVNLVFAAR